MKSGGKKVVYWLKIDIVIVYIVLIVDRVILSMVSKYTVYAQNSTVTSDGLLQKDCESSGRWWTISQQVLKIQW